MNGFDRLSPRCLLITTNTQLLHPLTAAATIGGLRSVRQQAGSGGGGGGGRGGGRDSRDVAEFLEDAVSPGGQARGRGGGAGRGSGSYERFIKAHKETVLSEEDRRFKTWTSWRESIRDEEEEDLDECVAAACWVCGCGSFICIISTAADPTQQRPTPS